MTISIFIKNINYKIVMLIMTGNFLLKKFKKIAILVEKFFLQI